MPASGRDIWLYHRLGMADRERQAMIGRLRRRGVEEMRAVYLEHFDADDPAAAVRVGLRPVPEPPAGWTTVHVKAAALNHHDVWSAKGIGLRAQQLPMILGCDAAGVTPDGRPVIVHGVVSGTGWVGPEELDPDLSLLSERHQGALAEQVMVPTANLVAKPDELTFVEAACLPTAWLTAYRALFVQAALRAGQTLLIQGASGGLSSAAIMLADAAGIRVWVTGRSAEKRRFAERLGADASFDVGERLPDRVDAVLDSVGAATWTHSLRALRKGGTMVVTGGTSGLVGEAEIARIFYNNLRIQGSTMGTKRELEDLVSSIARSGLRPPVEAVLPLDQAAAGIARLAAGSVLGKIVLTP